MFTDRCRAAIKDLNDLPLSSFPTRPLLPRTFELWADVTTQDACYITLAAALRCDFVTGDQPLATATGSRCHVRAVTQDACELGTSGMKQKSRPR
ncbi:MAG: type II toxin-antitoxin system VapC family toxin [Actinomycetia bacterium]|nr:type II toxin-antitoxin system VapC family toxin [Actinomycetes bacterium]